MSELSICFNTTDVAIRGCDEISYFEKKEVCSCALGE